jgi:hypothetical protein
VTATAAIAASARHSRAILHARLRFRRPSRADTAAASGDGPDAPDASSADFTALANRSSISLLGAKLGLACDFRVRFETVYAARA